MHSFPPTRRASRLRAALRIAIGPRAVVLAALVALAGTELGLYRAGYGRATPTELDERLGWRKIPNRTRTGRSGIEVRINSFGYRDREWDPPGTQRGGPLLRVAVLGDSVTFGARVPVDETWSRLLQRAIEARDARAGIERDVLALNFAMPGYVIEQMARQYEDDVRAFEPDLVVLAVTDWAVGPMRSVGRARDFPLRRWIVSTALYDWFQREVAMRHGIGGGRAPVDPERELADRAFFADPHAAEHAPLWIRATGMLAEMQRDLDRRGGRLAIVSLPVLETVMDPKAPWGGPRFALWCQKNPPALHVDLLSTFRAASAPLAGELEEKGLDWRQVWVRHGASEHSGALQHARQALYFFEDEIHQTPLAHAFIARGVLEALEAAGALGARAQNAK